MTRQTTLLSVLAAVLVIALWWLFLYSPGQDELAQLEDEIAAAETETASLQQRVAALEAIRARAPETEAAIAQLSSIIPDDPALSAALRQIVAAAEDAGVELDNVTTPRPAEVDELSGLHSVSLNLTATGSYFQVVDFLRRLEDPAITARGIVFNSLTVTPTEYPLLTLALTGEMFAVLEPVPQPADETTTAPPPPSADGTEAPAAGTPADEAGSATEGDGS